MQPTSKHGLLQEVKVDLSPERCVGIFRQHTKLKDILGGEEGTRQRA